MSNGLFIGDKDPIEIRVGSRKATSVFLGDKKVWSNVPDGAILHLNAKGLTTEGIKQENGIPDLSGNGNNAKAIGNVTVVHDDEIGDCFYSTNKSGTAIKTANSIPFSTYNGNISFCFDVKYDSGNYFPFIVSSPSNFQVELSTNYNQFQVYINGNNSSPALLEIRMQAINKWYRVAIVFTSNDEIKLYHDGKLINQVTNKHVNWVDGIFTLFGLQNTPSNRSFLGWIGNVYIYPRALTAHEVKKLYGASM